MPVLPVAAGYLAATAARSIRRQVCPVLLVAQILVSLLPDGPGVTTQAWKAARPSISS